MAAGSNAWTNKAGLLHSPDAKACLMTTYGLFWKMAGGMGDVVFAPLYEVLKRRGARFEFFHRLENVRLADPATPAPGERPYVEALELDVQARVRGGGEYQQLIDVRGLPSWPSRPDYRQLEDGERLRDEEDPAPIPAVDEDAGDRSQHERRDLSGEPDDAEEPRRSGHSIHEPGRGDLRHPGADQRDALSREEEPEVAMAKGAADRRPCSTCWPRLLRHGLEECYASAESKRGLMKMSEMVGTFSKLSSAPTRSVSTPAASSRETRSILRARRYWYTQR